MLRIIGKFFLHLLMTLFLTALTQIGGIVYLLTLLILAITKRRFKFQNLLLFSTLYLVATFLITPPLARQFGREPVQHSDRIRPTNYATVLLNRNYVTPRMNRLLQATANDKNLINNNIQIRYLDACFPFIKRFPLLPHLSHHDGRKIDISLIYETSAGELSNRKKSVSGYGVFVDIQKGEPDQVSICKKQGYWQYDFPQYLTFGSINSDLKFSKRGTKILIDGFLKQSATGKILIEPHLKQRLRLQHGKIRYHGCHAVRHDDHIHVQL
ncbi:MAG: hypothetical protein AB8G22_15410 [Saprospiraceae bacterium]